MEEFYLHMHFNRLVEAYPNKRNGHAAYKAFKVAINSEEPRKQEQTAKKILHAAKVYAFDTAGEDSDFLFLLSNFIREDHWQDIIGMHSDFDAYLASIDEIKKEAEQLIAEWNKACRPHWAKVHAPEKKIDIAIHALKSDEFRKHWKDALKKAKLIFYRSFRDNEKNAWMVISLPWFCKTKTDSHTVLKIIDGEYGKAYDRNTVYPVYKERTKSDMENARKLFKEVFKDFNIQKNETNSVRPKVEEINAEEEFD